MKSLRGIGCLFGIFLFFVSISIIPHYFFQTNAYDLGIFNEALSNYSQWEIGPSTLRHVPSLLGDHFEVYLLLLSPLSFLLGSYTLLVVQIVAVFIMAWGVYRLVMERTHDRFFAGIGGGTMLILFGTVIAVSFDFHNDVLGAMFLPWILYYWEKKKIYTAFLLAFLMGLAKEPFFLFSAFFGLSVLIFDSSKKNKIIGGVFFAVSFGIFLLLLKVIIPFFGTGEYGHWSYGDLGDGPVESLLFLLTHPFEAFSLFFSDPLKTSSLTYLLFAGLATAVFFPRYALVFLPFLAEKYFSSNTAHWGIHFHYNIVLSPLIAMCVPLFLYFLRERFASFQHVAQYALIFWVFGNLALTTRLGWVYVPEYFSDPVEAFQNRSQIQEGMTVLYNTASKSDSMAIMGNIVPHVVMDFPLVYVADGLLLEDWTPRLILLDTKTSIIWPFSTPTEVQQVQKRIEHSSTYTRIFENDSVVLYQKKL